MNLSTMIYGKVPPQAKDLERAILGIIMLETSAFSIAYEIVKPLVFYVEGHQRIFSCFERLYKKNRPIDILTVVEELKTTEELELVGGAYYVTGLTTEVVSSANLESWCRIVLQKFIQREIIRISGDLIGEAYEDSTDPLDLLSNANDNLRDINAAITESSKVNIVGLSIEIINDLHRKVHNDRNNIVDNKEVFTGITDWDKINGALFNGVYVVAARPGVGKGVHMAQCICNMANKYKVGVCNAEMTNKQLITRLACNVSGIDNNLFKKHPSLVTDEELTQLHNAMEQVNNLQLSIDSNTYIHKVINKIKLWVQRDKVQVIFADVLSKFKVPEDKDKYYTEVQKINYVMDAFVECSKHIGVPIILYAHLNRELYKRGNKEPNLSDLKGSGAIEDFAFQISFLHRPEYYEIMEDENGESTKGLMYQIIAKHRDGEHGKLKQRFLPQFSRLEKWENEFVPGWKPTENFF